MAHAQDVDVAALIVTQHAKERQENLICLVAILDSVKYLARQGLAIRGATHAESNLVQLLKLRSQNIESLSSWISRTTNWTHWDAQNEMLELLAKHIQREILNEIRENGVFSVMADETSDQSRQEQLVILVRHVDKNLEIEENLLGLYVMEKCDSASITNAICDTLLRCNLDIHRCRGQAYDGATAMMGSKSGVGFRIKEMESRAARHTV